jgi:hypothetical protein
MRVAAVSLLLASGLWFTAALPLAAGPSLLVLNKGDLTMAIVDASTLQVTGRVPTGPDPHEVEASADGRYAYVSNVSRGNGAANTITVIDLLGKKQLVPIDLGQLARPHGLHYSGDKLYFTACEAARPALQRRQAVFHGGGIASGRARRSGNASGRVDGEHRSGRDAHGRRRTGPDAHLHEQSRIGQRVDPRADWHRR